MIRPNAQILCYLTPEARLQLEVLKAQGVDEDLALTLLEQLVPESQLFDIDAEDSSHGTATG